MKTRTILWFPCVMAWAVLHGLLLNPAAAGQSEASAAIVSGTGLSALADAEAAAIEAATKAHAALEGQPAKIVLVSDNVAEADKEKLLRGVASIFPAELIHGCSAYAPITEDGNEARVGVLALGGDVEIAAALADVADGHEACGRRIAGQLKVAADAAAEEHGRLLVLFGNCHVPSNDALAAGAAAILGETFPIVGGAAEGDKPVYFKGRVHANINVGILLTGDFSPRFSFQGNQGTGADVAIRTAAAAAEETVGDDAADVLLVLAFDCGGRRGWLGDEVARELAAMTAVTGRLPLFGWYGSGEIGMTPQGRAAGEGFHLAMCALLKRTPSRIE